jgi:hypothetical protein
LGGECTADSGCGYLCICACLNPQSTHSITLTTSRLHSSLINLRSYVLQVYLVWFKVGVGCCSQIIGFSIYRQQGLEISSRLLATIILMQPACDPSSSQLSLDVRSFCWWLDLAQECIPCDWYQLTYNIRECGAAPFASPSFDCGSLRDDGCCLTLDSSLLWQWGRSARTLLLFCCSWAC